VYIILYSPSRGNRSHYYTYVYIIIIVNCYFFSRSSCTSISFFLIFTISFSLRIYASLFHSSYPCLLRQRISQLSSGRATIILRLIYAIPRLHPSHVAPPARHPCDGRWTHVLRRRVYVYNSSSSEMARFDSDLRRIHTHTILPSSVVKFKTLPLGLSLDL
jgi:hypothetical protein